MTRRRERSLARQTRSSGSGRFTGRILLLLACGLGCLFDSDAPAALLNQEKFKLFGDYRIRGEADWGSRNPSGVARDDRNRIRIRARLGLSHDPGETLSFGVRLRTGSHFSQQSPHITILDFDDNDTGDAHINLDKWFVKARRNKVWASIGRDSLPLWKQNEIVWDDDVVPAGVAGGFETDTGLNGNLVFNAGYFALPVGMREFAGKMASGQLVYSLRRGKSGFTAALGHLAIHADRTDPDAAALLRGNGARDYALWVASLQGRFSAGDRPVAIGADLLHNGEDYPEVDPTLSAGDPDQVTFDNRDETGGYVLSVKLGELKESGDWLVAYCYAHVEALAVNASYAQDDWVRWGSATETRGSDMKGHELLLAYAVSRQSDLVLRLYLTEAVTSVEDGNRFRIDYNRRF